LRSSRHLEEKDTMYPLDTVECAQRKILTKKNFYLYFTETHDFVRNF